MHHRANQSVSPQPGTFARGETDFFMPVGKTVGIVLQRFQTKLGQWLKAKSTLGGLAGPQTPTLLKLKKSKVKYLWPWALPKPDGKASMPSQPHS